jgi:HK97 family phage major capsid protein
MNKRDLQQRLAALVDEEHAFIQRASVPGYIITDEERQADAARSTEMGQIRSKLQEYDALEARLNSNRAEDQRMRQVTQPPDRSASPASAGPFRSLGEQLTAVATAGMGRGIDPRLVETRAAGLNEGVPSEGGFLVQTDFVSQLLQTTHDVGVIAPRCRRIPISGPSNGVKIPGVDETSRADGSRWGGVRAYWFDEASLKTESKPAFRRIELKLKKLIGLCYATDELLEDASALAAVVQQAFSEEFAFKVDDAIINGLGAGQPLGILASPCLITVAKETGQLAATIVVENLVKIYSQMYPRGLGNAVWLVNQEIFPQLYTMGITVGVGGSPIYMPPGGISGQPYSTLFGRPVIPVEQCAALGSVGDIIFGDFSQYLIAEKGGMQAASSIHVRFIYDESVFRFVLRLDGQPTWNSALTPYKGSAKVGPFIVLALRA